MLSRPLVFGISGVLFFLTQVGQCQEEERLQYRDAYIHSRVTSPEDAQWTLGNGLIEKSLVLDAKGFAMSFLRNKATMPHREYVQGQRSPEFRVVVSGVELTSTQGKWVCYSHSAEELTGGRLALTLRLRHGGVQVSKTYVVYPESPVIREQVQIENCGDEPLETTDSYFLSMLLRLRDEKGGLSLGYFTGAFHFADSQRLVVEQVNDAYARTFESPYAGVGHMPLMALFATEDHHGCFWGWDYLGPWAAPIGALDGRGSTAG